MKKLYLIRHGETESNLKGLFRGRLDIPLSRRGKQQAAELKGYFETIGVDTVYTSPLGRAIETARTAFPDHEPVFEPMLDNLDLGEWSGQNKMLVQEQFPGKWEQWVKRPETITFPGGESLADVMARSRKFLDKVVNGAGESIAAVSHRSVAKVILAASIGLERNYYWKFHLDNASVSQVFYDEERGYTLVRINDTYHLSDTTMEWY